MSEIRIDEHTVVGCPSCHSTNVTYKSYLNHLTNKTVSVTQCYDCGYVFEVGDAIRIPKRPEVDEVTKMKETIKDLEYRIDVLERKLNFKPNTSYTFVCGDNMICPDCRNVMYVATERKIGGRRWYECPNCHKQITIKEGKNE